MYKYNRIRKKDSVYRKSNLRFTFKNEIPLAFIGLAFSNKNNNKMNIKTKQIQYKKNERNAKPEVLIFF